jgi:plastocyanin
MRRLLLILALAAIAITAAACAASTGPGWTYAPPTVPPPSQPAASADASAATSAAPASASPSDAGSGGSGGAVVQISALNIAFEQSDVTAPAGAPFTIHFNNKDAGTPHNIEIKDASGMQMFMGQIVTGPIETDYSVPALPAGTYQFVCTVHPNMVGTLNVGG